MAEGFEDPTEDERESRRNRIRREAQDWVHLPKEWPVSVTSANSGNAGGGDKESSQFRWWLLGGLMTISIAITLAFASWAAVSIMTLQKEVAVIQCQLSEQCRKVLMRGGE